MRNPVARSLTVASVGLAVFSAPAARAQQTDTNPPLPNVLLLLDNSGSMERMIDGTLPEDTPKNNCNCTEIPGNPPAATCIWAAQPASPNRWGVLTQALTGSLQGGYNCISMPRTAGGTFTTEYQIGHVNPYDTGYYLNYHRPIAEDTSSSIPVACVYAPGQLPGANTGLGVGPNGAGSGAAAAGAGQSALDFPPGAIITRPYAQYAVTAPNSCVFSQYSDGVVPTYTSLVRFGLMTFDSDPSQLTGVTTGAPPLVAFSGTTDPLSTATGAFAGMWSYYPGWTTGGTCPYSGNPANCATTSLMAVGARNPAAPPWEGRMVMFPTANDLTTQEQFNTNVASVINSTRPYGGTPLAGMFTDAKYYFWTDPNGPQQVDPFVQASAQTTAPCREQYIILMTDGAPNMDLRPDCAAASTGGNQAGTCPFALPETIAATLYAGGPSQTKVTTFVIGFAVSSVQDGSVNVQCSSLVNAGTLSVTCSDPTKQALYGPCCELQRIAIAGTGGTAAATPAFFADNPGDLQKALGTILGLVSKNSTTRTVPAYAPAATNVFSPTNGTTVTNASVYLASFQPSVGLPWTGDVIRERYDCKAASGSFTVPPPVIDTSQGDSFAADVNSTAGSLPRTFIAIEPAAILEKSVTTHDATLTIRPYITGTAADGLPVYSGTTFAGSTTTLVTNLTPDALGISATTCKYTSTSSTHAQETLTANDCMTAILDYETATTSFGGSVKDFPFVSRAGRALGDIYHATPAVVGPPAALDQDPLYTAFQSNISPPRKNVLYAATNDGMLHAFWADETTLENNEYWAFIPPAVMPDLPSSYPNSHEFLLDGSPIVKDVVWERLAATDPTAASATNPWHTMLVAGFGAASTLPGYYALDVTQPDPGQLSSTNATIPSTAPPNAPVFRWQLTTVPTGNFPIFGQHPGTPALATLFMDPDGMGPRDIGVAILPGGQTGAATTSAGHGASCSRWSQLPTYATRYTDSAPLGSYTARTAVRCWGPTASPLDPIPGRSVTIVRLDTGEILRVFTRKPEVQNLFPGDTLLQPTVNRITDVPFDSPMTGTPIIYPSDVGADTTKIFIGDADGTLWRLDVSDPIPANWTGGLYLDAYNGTVDTNATAWSDGQPFEVNPTLALDSAGEVVLDATTTTTDQFDQTGIYTLYSITEKVQGTSPPALRAFVNWSLNSPLTPTTPPGTSLAAWGLGERVSGPMTVFNGTLFFSTYAAGAPGSSSLPATTTATCNNGIARIWGLDFAIQDSPTSTPTCYPGGKAEMPNIPPASATPSTCSITPSTAPGYSGLAGAVIPGVSIRQSPACASTAPGAVDPFTGASHASVSNFTPGSYSVFAGVGQQNSGGLGSQTVSVALPTPIIPTRVDSWAAIFE
jgi:type IV pilus assembly protein PilY1